MSVKRTAFIGATVITLAVGANQALAPTTPTELREQNQQQQVENMADAHEQSTDRMRDQGNDAVNAEETQKLTPGEPRPPERPSSSRLKFPLRIP